MSRSQSILRIATTASPVSGAVVSQHMFAVAGAEQRFLGALLMQRTLRMARAQGASQEQLMEMIEGQQLTQTQLNQIMRERRKAKKMRGIMGTRFGGGDGDDADAYELPTHSKSDETRLTLIAACKASTLFASSNREQLADAADAMAAVEVIAGTDVITQGDRNGDLFYVVGSGEFSVHLNQAGGKEVHRYVAGSSFGELALMYNCRRAATVHCAVEGTLWCLDRKAYKFIMRRAVKGAIDMAAASLELVPEMAGLTLQQRVSLASILEEVQLAAGEVLAQAGDLADALYLIKQGEIILSASAYDSDSASTRLTTPSHIGAFALKKSGPASDVRWDRQVSAARDAGNVVLLKLTPEKLIEHLGPLDEVNRPNKLLATLQAVPFFSFPQQN